MHYENPPSLLIMLKSAGRFLKYELCRIIQNHTHHRVNWFLMKNEILNKLVLYKHRIVDFFTYKCNLNYENVRFNPFTNGLMATHKKHSFDKSPLRENYEHMVQRIGYEAGHKVILEKEIHTEYKKRNTEGTWDDKPFEIAAAETNTAKNIRNALKHCASKPNCMVAVVLLVNHYSEQTVNEGLRAFNGLKNAKGQWKLFNEIVFIYKGNIIKKIKPIETSAF